MVFSKCSSDKSQDFIKAFFLIYYIIFNELKLPSTSCIFFFPYKKAKKTPMPGEGTNVSQTFRNITGNFKRIKMDDTLSFAKQSIVRDAESLAEEPNASGCVVVVNGKQSIKQSPHFELHRTQSALNVTSVNFLIRSSASS